MTTTTKESKRTEIAQQLNNNVLTVIGSKSIIGFEKAYMVSDAIGQLKVLLTNEYMKPIMNLQGNRLGFKTDKDDKGGYTEDQVKNCLIEAVLTGVQPTGNQFNIIAGNCYITKEGFGYLLNEMKGLTYQITFSLPRINPEKTSAAIVAKIKWNLEGKACEQEIDIPVKMNAYMGSDAVIGKATRKARAWLFNNITGVEIGDGDIEDAKAETVSSKMNSITLEDLKLLYDMKYDFVSEEDKVHIDRIIKQQETNSYKKAQDLLLKY